MNKNKSRWFQTHVSRSQRATRGYTKRDGASAFRKKAQGVLQLRISSAPISEGIRCRDIDAPVTLPRATDTPTSPVYSFGQAQTSNPIAECHHSLRFDGFGNYFLIIKTLVVWPTSRHVYSGGYIPG
ncbi:unnamed protein product [Ectocarpus sp. 6 AP-2014]